MQLKNSLLTMKYGLITINDLVRKIKDVADAHVSSGQEINEEELIHFIVDGLGPKFDVVIGHVVLKIESPF